MKIIKKLKNNFKKDYLLDKKLQYNLGLRLFQVGVFLLAAAPVFAFILLLSSSVLGSFNIEKNYFDDKLNQLLTVVSLLMIINCIFISLNRDLYSNDTSNIWIGLSNWVPFFWCFWGFQPYLINNKLRIQISKFFLLGSLPVIFSGFTQYFFKIYGPFNLFNNLIIWYQRPLGEDHGVTGLFNNQNYAGAWLCILLPLCISFLIKGKRIKKILLFLLGLSFIYMIFLTTSRIAIFSIFFSAFLFSKSFKRKLFILFSFLSVPLFLNIIPILSLRLQSIVYDYLPYELVKKTSLVNNPNLNLFPRWEVWVKSIEFIKSNPLSGYGAGSFKSLYDLSNGEFGDIQHSHNIFLEIAINHGVLASLLIVSLMIWLTFKSWPNYSKDFNLKGNNFDKAWIISFMVFLLIHMFDITYFDGRISTVAWILLSGMRCISLENKETKRIS